MTNYSLIEVVSSTHSKSARRSIAFIVPTLCVGMPPVTLCVTHRWSDAGCIPTQRVTAIKLRKNYDKANTYVDKSPLTPLFQRGGISIFFAFFAELVRKRASPFEKGGLRGIFKIHNIMIINTLFLNLMVVTQRVGTMTIHTVPS